MKAHRPIPSIQTGDIVCCWGTDRISLVISLMTSWYSWLLAPWGLKWSPSHVAIIVQTVDGHPLWYESTTLTHGTGGVQVHEPVERWADYRGRCTVYRLTEGSEFSAGQVAQLRARLQTLIETQVPYDLSGAILSGTTFIQRWLPSRTRALFCSELIARLLMEVGRMNWASASRYNPGRLLRQLVRDGIYERLEP